MQNNWPMNPAVPTELVQELHGAASPYHISSVLKRYHYCVSSSPNEPSSDPSRDESSLNQSLSPLAAFQLGAAGAPVETPAAVEPRVGGSVSVSVSVPGSVPESVPVSIARDCEAPSSD